MSDLGTPTTSSKPQRPVFRNINILQIIRYRLPLAGKVSILHRISGALLFLALPLIILPLFDRSLSSEISFVEYKQAVDQLWVKLILLVLVWGYLHHFVAGIRYLLLDLHIGISKEASNKSAGLVLGISLALTVILGLKLFGAF